MNEPARRYIVGKPYDFAVADQVFFARFLGWLERAVELTGGHRPEVEEATCRARGDACCTYAGSYE